MKNRFPSDRRLDIQQARAAGNRYKERVEIKRADITPVVIVEPPDNRKKYLKATLTKERARATVTEAESRGAPRSAAETLASLAHERIIGSSDLRDINYLEVAVAVARAVCRIRIGPAAGTGMLVGPRLLMTNNHVLRSVDDAMAAEAQFELSGKRLRRFIARAGISFRSKLLLPYQQDARFYDRGNYRGIRERPANLRIPVGQVYSYAW